MHINYILSHSVSVTSGVPQGSILGPLLFALYINNLPNCLSSTLPFIYADDTKCTKTISSSDDIQLMQNDLDAISQWSLESELFFNESEFTYIHFWAKPSSIDLPKCTISNKSISKVEKFKDLSIILNSNLSLDHHYKKLLLRYANFLSYCVGPSQLTRYHAAKKLLYISIVRSQLLYCSQVWRPDYIKGILLLERIQRRHTKYIYKSSYKSRLLYP